MTEESEPVDLMEYLLYRAKTNFKRPDQIISLIRDGYLSDDLEAGEVNEEILLSSYSRSNHTEAIRAVKNVWKELQERKGTPERTILDGLVDHREKSFVDREELREMIQEDLLEDHEELGEIL